jgi:hypothetical protein
MAAGYGILNALGDGDGVSANTETAYQRIRTSHILVGSLIWLVVPNESL